MIRTFLFDMGNVLVSFCHDKMCRQMGALCGKSGGEVRRLLIDSGLQWEFERGDVTPDEFHRRFEDAVQKKVNRADLALASSDIFEANQELRPIVHDLKSRGYRLVLLSNTTIWHFEFVRERLGMLDQFDDFVLSCNAGAMKPDQPIYAAALAAIQCEPAEAFYTDDIPHYVDAGRKHGLDAEAFTGAARFIDQMTRRGISIDAG